MSEDDANEAALHAVAELMTALHPGSMVQRFVLMVETIDAENRWMSAFTAPDQRAWDSMGLLQYGLHVEAAAVRVEPPDDD